MHSTHNVVEIEPLLVSTTKAAELLSISPRKLWTLTKEGEIPSVRVGRRVMYSPSTLRKWIRARSNGSGNSSN